jgi:hypothetical protein
VAVSAGTIGTLVFGLWLAISLDAYHPWDGWVIAAIVLWALTGATGNRTGTEYNAARDRALELSEAGSIGPSADLLQMNRTRRGIVFHALTSLFVLLLLIDMIWKPGA